MLRSIDQAPFNTSLFLAETSDSELAERLARMGVYPGDELARLDEEAVSGSVRVRGPKGEVILGGGMAAKVIVHHDDGHKTPVLEMHPGETGHVEGLVCGSGLAEGLEVMGIREDDPVEMVRRVPPMNYLTLIRGKRVQLTEGVATKVWGEMNGQSMQFVMAGRGKPFQVRRLLAGRRAEAMLRGMGIAPGTSIVLEAVTPAQSIGNCCRDQVVLGMKSGLRLYLRPDQAASIYVLPVAERLAPESPAEETPWTRSP